MLGLFNLELKESQGVMMLDTITNILLNFLLII